MLIGALGSGACSGDSPTSTAPDTPPSVTISEPPDDGRQVFTSTVVTFSAAASDDEDGDLSASVQWVSSLDGPLGSGSSIAVTLSEGTHVVSAWVVDTDGLSATTGRTITSTEFTWTFVAAGGGHTCGVGFNGRAYCWGANWEGQLGATGRSDSDVPIAVGSTARFEILSAGYTHTCGVRVGGGVLCWGDVNRDHGILGNGQVAGSATPTLVDGSQQFRSVTSGEDYSCALDDAGGVYCWGSNWLGMLGRGVDRSEIEYATTPAKVDTAEPMEQLAGRNTHVCAINAAGSAYCWGSAGSGQVGDGGTSNWVLSPTPVVGGLAFEAVAASAGYTLAIRQGGRLYYWGSRIVLNGHGYQDPSDFQLTPDTLPTQELFVEVDGGAAYACGRRTDGKIYCWGGWYSQVLSPRNEHPPLVPAGGSSHVYEQIAAGDGHTCGLTSDGHIYCWGDGVDGALGNGQRGTTIGAVRVRDPAPG